MNYVAKLVVVCGAYYGTAKLGLALAYEHSSVTAVWPPTGIALAATLIWGYRIWPAVALGALLANSWTGVPAITVLGITTGNTLEALAGAYLLRRVDFRSSLERVRDVVALVALAAMVSTIVSATIGVASLHIGGGLPGPEIVSTWRTWWLGDMGGVLLVAPVLLLAAGPLEEKVRARTDEFERSNAELALQAEIVANIAEAIVKAHGGKIEVESEMGTGTAFRVRLPLREPSTVIDLGERRMGAAA